MQQFNRNNGFVAPNVPVPKRDTERGRWSSTDDFICACIGSAFKLDVLPGFVIFLQIGSVSFLPCIIYLAVIAIPLLMTQTFMGQFSSTAFITTFRMSPLFKGVGYLGLVLNLISAGYSIIFASVPLFYFINSFQFPLPWSCDEGDIKLPSELCGEFGNDTSGEPAINFLRSEMGLTDDETLRFSWTLFFCGISVWTFVAFIVSNSTETIGLFFRWSLIVLFGLLFVCVGRFTCLTSAWIGVLKKFFDLKINTDAWIYSPFIFLTALGPGWGTIISLSSYNHFKSNIARDSWMIVLGQLSMVMMLGLLIFLTSNHFKDADTTSDIGSNWLKLLSGASALVSMDFDNMWCVLYFTMLTLAGVFLLVVQVFAVLTALFDEFEELRTCKRKVTLSLVSALALVSIIFSTNVGFNFESALAIYVMFGNIFLNSLLILIVFWVFGRSRFMRDFNFMTGRTFSTWQVYGVRFLTTPLTILTGVLYYKIAFDELNVEYVLVLLLWLVVPIYSIYLILQKRGTLLAKFKESVQPTHWHPVDNIHLQKYEANLAVPPLKA